MILVDQTELMLRVAYSQQTNKPDQSWGLCNHDKGIIFLDEDQTPEKMYLTFCHEVAHLLADAMGKGTDEELAESLERPLASLLAENDWS